MDRAVSFPAFEDSSEASYEDFSRSLRAYPFLRVQDLAIFRFSYFDRQEMLGLGPRVGIPDSLRDYESAQSDLELGRRSHDASPRCSCERK